MANFDINVNWHEDFNGSAMFNSSGTLTVTRSSQQDPNIRVYGTITTSVINRHHYNAPPYFGKSTSHGDPYAGITMYVTTNEATGGKATRTYYDVNHGWGNCPNVGWWVDRGAGGSWSIWIDNTLKFTWGTLTLHGCCRWLLSGICDMGHNDVTIGRFGIENVPYNPYSEPSIGALSITPEIGIFNSQDFNYRWSMSKGTNDLSWVHLDMYQHDTDNCLDWKGVGTSFGNRSENFRFGSGENKGGYTGGKFQGMVALHDGKNRFTTNRVTIYTYTKPTMSASLSSLFSPQDNASLTWTTNSRTWVNSNRENNFKTIATINGQTISVSQNPTNSTDGSTQSSSLGNSVTFDNSFLINTAKYTAAQRSVAQMSGSITLTRRNEKAGTSYDASDTKSFKVQYQPTKTPTGGNVTNSRGTSVKNTTIIVQDTPTINIDWSYPNSGAARGVVNGYILRVYSDSNYSSKVGSDHIINVNSWGASGTIQLNTRNDLKRGVMNYAKIIPFYTRPDGNGRIEGTNSLNISLVKPIARLDPPTIQYPINNSNWHNKYFRVLVLLPEDDDIQALINDGTISNKSNYKYGNIQIRITPSTGSAVTYSMGTSSHSSIFSVALNDIPYYTSGNTSKDRKIAICPALLTLPDVSSYKIEMRVQKKYYNLTEAQSWSNWSSAITVKNTAVDNLSLNVGQTIEANHYKYVRNASVRLYNTYPIVSNGLNGNIDQNAGNQIDYSEYQAIYNTILAIKSGVNNYCKYNNTNVSFTQTINDLTNNPPKQEFITAEKTPSSIAGRNYKNILIDDMNKLY